jgi:hypothetical protein
MRKDEKKIGLTPELAYKIFKLSYSYTDKLGYDVSTPNVWLVHTIGLYLLMLAEAAETENKGQKSNKIARLRRETLKDLEEYFGRPPTAADLLNPVSQALGKVDDAIADAIDRDIKRLTE